MQGGVERIVVDWLDGNASCVDERLYAMRMPILMENENLNCVEAVERRILFLAFGCDHPGRCPDDPSINPSVLQFVLCSELMSRSTWKPLGSPDTVSSDIKSSTIIQTELRLVHGMTPILVAVQRTL